MQTNSSQYLSLAQYLLIPSRGWRIFISSGIVILLSIGAFFELKGTESALYKSVVLLAVVLSLGFFTIPFRMRVLLGSKVFLLSAPSARVLLVVAAAAFGVWVTVVTTLVVKGFSLSAITIMATVWSFASLFTLVSVVFPKFFIAVGWIAFVGLSRFGLLEVFATKISNSTTWLVPVFAFFVGIGAWFVLYKVSVVGQISKDAFVKKNNCCTGPMFTFFSHIQLGKSDFDRFLKATLQSGHPLISTFLMGCWALLMIVAFFVLMGFIGGDEPGYQLTKENYNSRVMFLLFVPAVMVSGIVFSVARRLRVLWLLLPENRLQLIGCIDRIQFLITPIIFFPIALMLLAFSLWGLVPLLKVLQTMFIGLVTVALFYYWFFYIYGRDVMWSGIGSLLLLAMVAVYYGISLALPPFHLAIFGCLVVAILLCLFVRFKTRQRWARIDFTELRSSWPL